MIIKHLLVAVSLVSLALCEFSQDFGPFVTQPGSFRMAAKQVQYSSSDEEQTIVKIKLSLGV